MFARVYVHVHNTFYSQILMSYHFSQSSHFQMPQGLDWLATVGLPSLPMLHIYHLNNYYVIQDISWLLKGKLPAYPATQPWFVV